MAPMETEAGIRAEWLAPTSMRATWGMTRPTQPMMPASETVVAVTSVAATITTQRITVTLVPSDLASTSESERMLSRQRKTQRAAMPTPINGAPQASIS